MMEVSELKEDKLLLKKVRYPILNYAIDGICCFLSVLVLPIMALVSMGESHNGWRS